MNNHQTQVLNDVVAVHLRFSTWTGRKKLADSDLSLRGEVPPKEIIALGSKYTTDPKDLKVFNTLKRRAERLCLSVGIPFMGGYAIPSSKADDLAKGLSQITQDYEKEANAYCAKHDSIQDEWVSKFPEYEQKLRAALTPSQEVRGKISATFNMFKVQSAQAAVQSVDIGMSKEIDGLSDSLDADILKTASKLLKSLTEAVSPSHRTNVAGLIGLREKVEGLAFLNGRFHRLVQEIKKVEGQMPITGKLSTDETNILSGLLYRMADKEKLNALMHSLQSEPVTAPQQTVSLEPEVEVQNEPSQANETEIQMEDNLPFDEASFSFEMSSLTQVAPSENEVGVTLEAEPLELSTDAYSFDLVSPESEENQSIESEDNDLTESMPLSQEREYDTSSNTEWFF